MALYDTAHYALLTVQSVAQLGEDTVLTLEGGATLICTGQDVCLAHWGTSYGPTSGPHIKVGHKIWVDKNNKSGHPSSLDDQITMHLLAEPQVAVGDHEGLLILIEDLQHYYREALLDRDAWRDAAIRKELTLDKVQRGTKAS